MLCARACGSTTGLADTKTGASLRPLSETACAVISAAPDDLQRVNPAVRGLQVGRDADIAHQHRRFPKLVLAPINRDEGFRNEFWDAARRLSSRNQN